LHVAPKKRVLDVGRAEGATQVKAIPVEVWNPDVRVAVEPAGQAPDPEVSQGEHPPEERILGTPTPTKPVVPVLALPVFS
jgi:hypothetical protein